jgi:hypothetical protein
MSNGSVGDPIFPGPPVVPPAPGHPQHEKHHEAASDWVVIHRGGEGSKAHVQSLEHKLIKAKIPARVEHDDEHRVVLEVPREHEAEAKKVIGSDQVSGVGEKPHQTSEERIQAEERAELKGPFKAATTGWVLVVVAIAVLALLAFWMFPLR